MRDNRFVAEHRGGPLKKEQHQQLIKWSYSCVEHVLSLLGEKIDERIVNTLLIAKKWEQGQATVGEARQAAVAAHALAREALDPTLIAIARATGHTVATAHMADHSLRGALYALKAVKSASQSVAEEIKWQNEQLPIEIRELVLTNMKIKEKNFKL